MSPDHTATGAWPETERRMGRIASAIRKLDFGSTPESSLTTERGGGRAQAFGRVRLHNICCALGPPTSAPVWVLPWLRSTSGRVLTTLGNAISGASLWRGVRYRDCERVGRLCCRPGAHPPHMGGYAVVPDMPTTARRSSLPAARFVLLLRTRGDRVSFIVQVAVTLGGRVGRGAGVRVGGGRDAGAPPCTAASRIFF